MSSNKRHPPSASRVVAGLCFWLAPFLVGVLYSAYDAYRPGAAIGHSFEYGHTGFLLGSVACVVYTLPSYIGFALALLAIPRFRLASARRFNLLSATAGLLTLLTCVAPLLMFPHLSRSLSGLVGFVFALVAAIATSAAITYSVLRIGWLTNFLHRLGADNTCDQCGYNLHGLQDNRCPECGQPFIPKQGSE